jgi:predicted RNA-binding protein with TRAM domain
MRSYVLDTPSRPVPVSNGEEHEVTIDAVGRKGDGIAKIQGFTIFVPNAKLGEHIKIKITSVRGNFAVAAKVE